MYSVIRSLLAKEGKEVGLVIKQALEGREYLLPDEIEMFEYLKQTVQAAQSTPSEVLFLDKFPDCEVFLNSSISLSVADARVRLSVALVERQRANIASRLAQIAASSAVTGITDGVWGQLRELRSKDGTSEPQFTCSVPNCHCSIPMSYGCMKRIYAQRAERPAGLLTFIGPIDNAIGGMAEGSLNTIMGFVGSFKTTFGMNIAYNNAVKLGYNIAYLSLEVSREDLWFNLISRHSFDPKFDRYPFIGHGRIRQCSITKEEQDYLWECVVPDLQAQKGKILVLQTSDFKSLDPDDIYTKLEEADEKMGGIDAFIWDHIQMFKFSSNKFKTSNEGGVMNAYANQFMRWSLDFRGRKTIQIMLAQVNRQGWLKAAKRGGLYDLTALAEVNEAERASSRVMSIYTDDNLKASKECRVQLLKSRFGPPIPDPVSVFVDPEAYVFSGMDQTDMALPSVDEFDQLLSEGGF